MNYQDVVEILKVSQDKPAAREERYETFKRAVSLYGVPLACAGATRPGENIILVAGTNGKGTVSATLSHLFSPNMNMNTNVQRSTGLFTSPHLLEPTERIAIDGKPISQAEMAAAYLAIESVVKKFDLSHFEILTLMMIEVFFGARIRPRVSRAIIEVGVGGRLDPTRVIPHETAVLARIGLDHEAILGHTLTSIAREKLAIAEGASRLIYMKPDESLAEVFDEARARYPSCKFIESQTFAARISRAQRAPASDPRWILKTPWGEALLSLLGERAVRNTSLALEVLNVLGEPVAERLPRLSTVVWPGRMERVEFGGRAIYLSGDHNEQGVESLREILLHFTYEKVWLVVGIGKGKPVEAMLDQYKKIPRAKLILTRTYFREIPREDFAALKGETKIDDAFEATKYAIAQASPNDLIVVSGSLYLVGDLKMKFHT